MIRQPAGEQPLIYFSEHLTYGATLPQEFSGLKRARCELCHPDLRLAVMDHIVPTTDCKPPMIDSEAAARTVAKVEIEALCRNYRESGIALVTDSFPMEK